MDKKKKSRTYDDEARYREAKEECAAFMAKMIEKYGDEVLKELQEKKNTEK